MTLLMTLLVKKIQFYRTFDGWLKQCDDTTNGNVVNASGDGKDYQSILARMITHDARPLQAG